jgi:ABC-type uncharacterized transport system involved in gliding motility auxiliary subunit
MANTWLKARQTKYGAYSGLYILVVIAILVTANMLANRYNKTFDTTSNKRYSLSDETKKIIGGLRQNATITYYNQSTRFREGKDLLDQYASLSPKIHVDYVDPDKQPQLAREANIRDFGTAVINIGGKKETAKNLTEEGITGAFIRDLKGTTRTVCFVTGSGEHGVEDSDRDGLSQFRDLLTKDEYVSRSIDLVATAGVPADCTTVVIAGPTHDYQQPEVDAIRTYIEHGGRALFMLDPPVQFGRSPVAANDALVGMLESWGVTPDKDMILDLNPIGQIAGLGPQVALVSTYSNQPIVAQMRGSAVGFPLSRSLQIKNTGKTTVDKLFDSSNSSLATSNLESAEVKVADPNNKKGPLTIAAAGAYNTGNPKLEGRFVVTGSSSWAANRFLGFNGNGDLALNMVNWLASDEDLISIRPKADDDRRITMTRAQLVLVRVTSQFVLPLIVIGFGIMVWWKRR